MYHREFKMRSIEDYQQLDMDFVGLLAYLSMHPPQKSIRKGYEEVERDIKGSLKRKTKEERATQLAETRPLKKAKLESRLKDDTLNGLATCGYDQSDWKGLRLIRDCNW